MKVLPLFFPLCVLLATPTAGFGRRPIVSNDPAPPAVLWYAPFLSGGGYCSEAHSYVVAVDTAVGESASSSSTSEDLEVEQEEKVVEKPFELLITQHGDSLNTSFIRDLPTDMKSKLEHHWIEERDFYWRLKNRKIALAICHSEPGAWAPAHYMTSRCPPEKAQYKVGRTMFETDRVPKGWPDRMNKMDEIWVPTKFQEKIFVDGGVKPEAVKVVPEVVDVDFFDPEKVEKVYDLAGETAFEMTEKTTVYLSIFKWEERKAWRVLLKAYFEAFKVEDDVVLVLLTNGYHTTSSSAEDFMGVIEKFSLEAVGKKLDELPHIHVLPPHIPQEAMPSLYKAADAFVLPSRGEGWGRPHVEAMAMERPLIATFWSGTTEYIGQTTRRFQGHSKDVLSVAFSADNRQIVSGSRDRTIKLWNTLAQCKQTLAKECHTDWVSTVRFSPNVNQPKFVSGGWDGMVKVWEAQQPVGFGWKTNHIGHAGFVNSVAVSPDGSLCASGGKDGTSMLWDLNEGGHVLTLGGNEVVNALAFSPDRYWLSAAVGSSIKIWDLETHALVGNMQVDASKKNAAEVTSLAWSSDGRTLFAGYTDCLIRVWRLNA